MMKKLIASMMVRIFYFENSSYVHQYHIVLTYGKCKKGGVNFEKLGHKNIIKLENSPHHPPPDYLTSPSTSPPPPPPHHNSKGPFGSNNCASMSTKFI